MIAPAAAEQAPQVELTKTENRRLTSQLRYQKLQREARAGERCISCCNPPLPGKTKCLRHYVRQLLNGAARVNTSATLPDAAPAFKVDDAAVEWALAEFHKQKECCYLSGRPLVIGENACLDHVLSRARYQHHHLAGGLENLRWADADVNRAKGQLTPEQFFELCREVSDTLKPKPYFERDRWGSGRGVTLCFQGERKLACLRATLPPKPGSPGVRARSHRISTGVSCLTPDGMRRAKALKARLEAELLERTFRWENWC